MKLNYCLCTIFAIFSLSFPALCIFSLGNFPLSSDALMHRVRNKLHYMGGDKEGNFAVYSDGDKERSAYNKMDGLSRLKKARMIKNNRRSEFYFLLHVHNAKSHF